MSFWEQITSLSLKEAQDVNFPHHIVTELKLIETHLSYVILTGIYAYKIKKNVKFDFGVDFTTLERRHVDCMDEVRLNRLYSSDGLYIGVVPIYSNVKGEIIFGEPTTSTSNTNSNETTITTSTTGNPSTPSTNADEINYSNFHHRCKFKDVFGTIIEYAVMMRQFPANSLAKTQIKNLNNASMFESFGRRLASAHTKAPVYNTVDACTPMMYNFRDLISTRKTILQWIDASSPFSCMNDEPITTTNNDDLKERFKQSLLKLESLNVAAVNDLNFFASLMKTREEEGYIRECHGDIHLGNIILLNKSFTSTTTSTTTITTTTSLNSSAMNTTGSGSTPSPHLELFDCLEFDSNLRRIDTINDIAFLFMDLCTHGKEHLAYSFVDGYLDESGDYYGAILLFMYARYRAMIRAKVAMLKLVQIKEDEEMSKKIILEKQDDVVSICSHIEWARNSLVCSSRLDKTSFNATIYLLCGLSGTGKSYWANNLVGPLYAFRVRSDILRKRSAKMELRSTSQHSRIKHIVDGIYSASKSNEVYESLATIASQLVKATDRVVIIDACSLLSSQRDLVRSTMKRFGLNDLRIIYFNAPIPILRSRIRDRLKQGKDPSEADDRVLEWQLEKFEQPSKFHDKDTPIITIDTSDTNLCTIENIVNLIKGKTTSVE